MRDDAEERPDPGPELEVSLPADRSFLLQFRARRLDAGSSEVSGRIEHVESGRSGHFESWNGLRRFIERTLGDVR